MFGGGQGALFQIVDLLLATGGEIDWADRLSVYNHSEFFPVAVTSIVDTAPMVINAPSDPVANALTYQPKVRAPWLCRHHCQLCVVERWQAKCTCPFLHVLFVCCVVVVQYRANVLKFQLIVTFNCRIVGFEFGFPGVIHDGTILRESFANGRYPMHDWELMLADGAYISVPHCLIPVRRRQGRFFTPQESAVNSMIAYARSRVEHVNAWIKQPFGIFNTPFRGSLGLAFALSTFIVHSVAWGIKARPLLYPVGPWCHDPAQF